METQTIRTLEEVLADPTPHEVTLYCWSCGAQHQFFGTFDKYYNFYGHEQHLKCPDCASRQYYTSPESERSFVLSENWDKVTGYKPKPSFFDFIERPIL